MKLRMKFRALSFVGLLTGPQSPHRILFIAGQQLSPFAHSPQARAVLALPGQDVLFVRGSMSEHQILNHPPSYINAILIQSRGRMEVQACTACRGSKASSVSRVSPVARPL
ncbi:hypothetical protein VTO42DRAFT_5679 [Malbranchea cinnamomea]